MSCGFVKAGDCYVNLANVTHVHLEAGGDAVVSYSGGGVTRFQGDAAVAVAEAVDPEVKPKAKAKAEPSGDRTKQL